MKKETTIPFAGFYYTYHDDALNDALNSVFSNDRGEPIEPLVSRAMDKIDWRTAHVQYSKDYTECLALALELKTLQFVEMTSPREYNFETDRIFCSIELSEIEKIFLETDKAKLDYLIAEKFTSRSGFISYYKNSLGEWPADPRDWDHNQIGTLLESYTEQKLEKEFDLWATIDILGDSHSERCYEIICHNLSDSEKLFKIHDYLRTREER